MRTSELTSQSAVARRSAEAQVRELVARFAPTHQRLSARRVHLPSTVRHAICPLLLSLTSCAPVPSAVSHVRIIAHDYAFEFPTTLSPGGTAFRLVNQGKVQHEVQLYRFRPGISRDSALRMLVTNKIPDSAVDVDGGVLIAGPADSTVQELLAPLRRGDVYALECAFRNTPDQPKHRDLGMVAVFEVK